MCHGQGLSAPWQAIMLASARRWIDANIVALKRRQPRGM